MGKRDYADYKRRPLWLPVCLDSWFHNGNPRGYDRAADGTNHQPFNTDWDTCRPCWIHTAVAAGASEEDVTASPVRHANWQQLR